MKILVSSLFCILLVGCGGSLKSFNPIDPPKVHAADPPDNVFGAVKAMSPGVYDVRMEAVWHSPGVVKLELPFDLPPNKSVAKIQGLISYNGASQCWSQAYAVAVFADVVQPTWETPQIVIAAVKANTAGGGSFSTFVNYDIPVSYQDGHGKIMFANTQECSGLATLEFDGLMKIE